MKMTRVNVALARELDLLIKKSTPYALSSPSFGNPTIHDFVKGLILSTNIIEVIDKYIPNGFRADWGQIIDERDGNTLSKECDIVIYRGKAVPVIKNRSMEFVFVKKKQARAVIQVRSSIQSVTEDVKNYCKELKKFVPTVWYVAECCLAKSKSRAETIKRQLEEAGYDQFFYFYRMDYDLWQKTIDYESFIKFIKLIEKIR